MVYVELSDYRVKVKEGKRLYKYLDLAKESKKLWNMKVTGIPIVEALKMRLDKLKTVEWIETTQTIALLKSAWMLKTVLETNADLLLLTLQLKRVWKFRIQ